MKLRDRSARNNYKLKTPTAGEVLKHIFKQTQITSILVNYHMWILYIPLIVGHHQKPKFLSRDKWTTLNKMFTRGILSEKAKSLSAKTKRVVSSIGQDLVYHANNGKRKTWKHVTFSFSMKRKTGPKMVINWISKFVYGISYDDVLILEKHLVMEHSKDQVNRSFLPLLIQPHCFDTFVWDNNDINPESLKGINRYCIKGMVIQKSHVPSSSQSTNKMSSIQQLQEARKQRIKNFTAITNEIPAYIQTKQQLKHWNS